MKNTDASEKQQQTAFAVWEVVMNSLSILQPPPKRYPDEWADANRVLPHGNAESGQWRSSRAPYCIKPMRACTSPKYDSIYVVMMAQGGKTQIFFNVIGHRLDDNPVPILYIGPTRNNLNQSVEPKIDDMLRGCKSLWNKVVKGKSYTKLRKVISGVPLRLAWAGSPTELSADFACLVMVDEIDRISKDIGGEGNIISLADARHSTYADGKTLGASTPTLGNVETETDEISGLERWKVTDKKNLKSPSWTLWQTGTRHEWAWPCPHCKTFFIPRFKLLWWPEGSTPEQAKKKAACRCPSCASLIEGRHKRWMNANGDFVAPGQTFDEEGNIVGDEPESTRATFWVSGLANFAAKKTFGYLAAAFLRAVQSGEQEAIQGVINTEFGECFKYGGEAPPWQEVKECIAEYLLGAIPSGVQILVAGVDVQKNRLVYVVRGYGEQYTSWLIDRDELWGETDDPDVWRRLSTLLHTEYKGLPISLMGIDSGYRAEQVYQFCRAHRGLAYPTKGHDHLEKPFKASLIDVNLRGKIIKHGLKLWHFDSDIMKSWVHERIGWPEHEPGAWYIPKDIDDDYCRQIVSEERVIKPSGKSTWIVTGENHYLDAEAISYLMRRIIGNRTHEVRTADNAIKNTQRPKRRVLNRGITA